MDLLLCVARGEIAKLRLDSLGGRTDVRVERMELSNSHEVLFLSWPGVWEQFSEVSLHGFFLGFCFERKLSLFSSIESKSRYCKVKNGTGLVLANNLLRLGESPKLVITLGA